MNDDVVFTETGSGKEPSVFAAKHQYLVTVAVQVDYRFMYKRFPRHGKPFK